MTAGSELGCNLSRAATVLTEWQIASSRSAVGGATLIALPRGASCAIYALPKEGSLAVHAVEGSKPLLIRVPEGASSLRLALKSEVGEPFSAMRLLLRIDGVVVPPAIACLLGKLTERTTPRCASGRGDGAGRALVLY